MILKETELHVHILQSLYPEDLFNLAKDHYKEINWNRFAFLDRYEKIFGVRLDPVNMFEKAIETGSIKEIEDVAVYRYSKEGNFAQFDIKSFFLLCITGYYFDKGDFESVFEPILKRHKNEGLKYVEYRNGIGYSYYEEWKSWHMNYIDYLKAQSTDSFQAKYIMRISPEHYPSVKRLIEEEKDYRDIIVGIDFSGREISPVELKPLYDEVIKDDIVDIVVHIGENFYDKSLESAIRWCHQSALFGAKRLGHCIALGINPLVAVERRKDAHRYETVKERIDQIEYDLKYHKELLAYGINVKVHELKQELIELNKKELDEQVERIYDENRLNDVEKRQNYVLDELKKMNNVIEVCPTSNLCIGGIPGIENHSFKKLYHSGVNLVICTDDPGVFKSNLSDEVDFVLSAFDLKEDELVKRLKDPYSFKLRK